MRLLEGAYINMFIVPYLTMSLTMMKEPEFHRELGANKITKDLWLSKQVIWDYPFYYSHMKLFENFCEVD